VDDAKTLDEVLVSIFKDLIPTRKYHRNILSWINLYPATNNQLLLRRMSYGRSGWIYTKSFLNGNLICHRRKQWPIWSSDNEAAPNCHANAGILNEIAKLREELLNFASLNRIELLRKKMSNLPTAISWVTEPNRVCPQTTYWFLCGRKRNQKTVFL
jgi:tRNA modification GTPase